MSVGKSREKETLGRTIETVRLDSPLSGHKDLRPVVSLAEDRADELLVVLLRSVNGSAVPESAAL